MLIWRAGLPSPLVFLVATAVMPPQLAAQASLDDAAGSIRAAWVGGDMRGVAVGSRAVRLEIPLEGAGGGGTLTSIQAAKLLAEYVAPASEVAFELRQVRSVGEDRGYVEGVRVFVVRGTDQELREVVFFGLELYEGTWRVVEVRIAS